MNSIMRHLPVNTVSYALSRFLNLPSHRNMGYHVGCIHMETDIVALYNSLAHIIPSASKY